MYGFFHLYTFHVHRVIGKKRTICAFGGGLYFINYLNVQQNTFLYTLLSIVSVLDLSLIIIITIMSYGINIMRLCTSVQP